MVHACIHGACRHPWSMHASMVHACIHGPCMHPWSMHVSMVHACIHGPCMHPWSMHAGSPTHCTQCSGRVVLNTVELDQRPIQFDMSRRRSVIQATKPLKSVTNRLEEVTSRPPHNPSNTNNELNTECMSDTKRQQAAFRLYGAWDINVLDEGSME